MSSIEAARIIIEAAKRRFPKAETIAVPIADGGEGSLDCFKAFSGGKSVFKEVIGPLGIKVEAEYLISGETAIIETAKAVGLTLAGEQKNPLITTTYGAGELVSDALEKGVKNIILTLGGSSTNDGGAGMAAALGVKFFKKSGKNFIPAGGTLAEIDGIDLSGLGERLRNARVTAMCDVEATVCGEKRSVLRLRPAKRR